MIFSKKKRNFTFCFAAIWLTEKEIYDRVIGVKFPLFNFWIKVSGISNHFQLDMSLIFLNFFFPTFKYVNGQSRKKSIRQRKEIKNLRVQSECRKIRTRKNSAFRQFSRIYNKLLLFTNKWRSHQNTVIWFIRITPPLIVSFPFFPTPAMLIRTPRLLISKVFVFCCKSFCMILISGYLRYFFCVSMLTFSGFFFMYFCMNEI